MSEPTISSSDIESKGTSRLKKLTSSSTWTSPFRNTGDRKNIIKEFKENNSVSQVHVPKKFTSHPHLDRGEVAEIEAKSDVSDKSQSNVKSDASLDGIAQETKVLAADTTVERAVGDTPDVKSVDAVKNEFFATPETCGDVESERPLTDAEKSDFLEDTASSKIPETAKDYQISQELEPVALVNENYGDDNIQEQVKETPIELDLSPEVKYVRVEAPNQKVLDSLADKPNFLNRYEALNSGVNSQNPTTLDGPDKVIDLGSGLLLTQQQLLDIAAKRVAPLIANINEEVQKTQIEDKIIEKQELSATVAKHNAKLTKDFEKHVNKIEKQRVKFDKEISAKLALLEKESNANTAASEDFERKTTQEIATANEEYLEREQKAMRQHEIDKETSLKNHYELEATKKQELADSKANQIIAAEDIETLQERKAELDPANNDLFDQLERLRKELAEREESLTAITGKLNSQKEAFNKNEETKKELNEKVFVAQKGAEAKEEVKSKLAVEVGLLGSAVAAYAAKLTSLKSQNDKKPERITAAKEKFNTWNLERKELAGQVAREHEQKRLESREAARTEQILAEIEEEKQRLEQQKQQYAEERARMQQEEKERQEQREREEQERRELEKKERQEAGEKVAKEAEEKCLTEEKTAQKAEEMRLAEEQAAKERKAAEERILTEEKRVEEKKRLLQTRAFKEKKETEERKSAEVLALKEKKFAEENAAKSKDVDTTHNSSVPETTVTGYALSGKNTKLSDDVSVPKEQVSEEQNMSTEPAMAPMAALKKEMSVSTTAVPMVVGKKKNSSHIARDQAVKPDDDNNHKNLAALGAGAEAAGLASVTLGSTSGNGDTSRLRGTERKESLSKKMKSVFSRKHKDEGNKPQIQKFEETALATSSMKAVNVASQLVKMGTSSIDAADLVSIYEEVSDNEYERHKDDPDYIEVDTVQAEKLLKRHKSLIPLLEKHTV